MKSLDVFTCLTVLLLFGTVRLVIGLDLKEQDTKKLSDLMTTNPNRQYECNVGEVIIVNQQKYTVLRPVGSGGTAYVCEVKPLHSQTTETLAVKIIKKHQSTNRISESETDNELKVHLEIKSIPGVVSLIDWENNSDALLMVMEYLPFSMFDAINKYSDALPVDYIHKYAKQILELLADMHKIGIVHLDLKEENIMMTEDLKPKLADFGSSIRVDQEIKRKAIGTKRITLPFAAPEVLKEWNLIKHECKPNNNEFENMCKNPRLISQFHNYGRETTPLADHCNLSSKVGFAADVYSFGVILYQMMYNQGPHQSLLNNLNLIGDRHLIMELLSIALENPSAMGLKIRFPPYKDAVLEQMVKDCLQEDQDQRPTVDELLQRLSSG